METIRSLKTETLNQSMFWSYAGLIFYSMIHTEMDDSEGDSPPQELLESFV
jgi:hypothetical protein